MRFLLQKTIDQSEQVLESKQRELRIKYRQREQIVKEHQVKEGLIVPSELEGLPLDIQLSKLHEALVVKRDFDLLLICERLQELSLFSQDIASLVLFDAYRGNFADSQLPTAQTLSSAQASAKLKLIGLLLRQVLQMPGTPRT